MSWGKKGEKGRREAARRAPPARPASCGSTSGEEDLVDEGQVPLDGRLVLLPLQPQLVAELLLGLLDVPDGQFPLLGLVGARNGHEG